MRSVDLFNRVAVLWPSRLSLGNASLQGEGGFLCWELNEKFEEIEQEHCVADEWLDLACWSFHQALWVAARDSFKGGKTTVDRSDVTLALFDQFLRRNLEDESWAHLQIDH